eukprot:1656049-Pleurochrysis_carterae.AAC.1
MASSGPGFSFTVSSTDRFFAAGKRDEAGSPVLLMPTHGSGGMMVSFIPWNMSAGISPPRLTVDERMAPADVVTMAAGLSAAGMRDAMSSVASPPIDWPVK